jgi:hypothetical protein
MPISFAARRRIVLGRRAAAERERVARIIAEAHTNCDPDTLVLPEYAPDIRVKGGFRQNSAPTQALWLGFLAAAEAVIADRGKR